MAWRWPHFHFFYLGYSGSEVFGPLTTRDDLPQAQSGVDASLCRRTPRAALFFGLRCQAQRGTALTLRVAKKNRVVDSQTSYICHSFDLTAESPPHPQSGVDASLCRRTPRAALFFGLRCQAQRGTALTLRVAKKNRVVDSQTSYICHGFDPWTKRLAGNQAHLPRRLEAVRTSRR